MAGELEFGEELRVKQTARMKTGRWRLWPYDVLLLAVLWLEMFFTTGCIVTLTAFAVDRKLLFAGAAVCGIVWTVFLCARKKWRFLLLFCYMAAAAVLLFMNRELFMEGLFYLENAVIKLINRYYGMSYAYHPVSAELKTAVSVFLVFLLQVVGACYAQVLFRARAAFLSAALLAVAAFSGLAVGIVPDPLFFIGAVFCILLQFALGRMRQARCLADGQVVKRDDGSRKKRAQAAFFVGVPAAAIGIIVSLIVNDEVYRERMDMHAKKQQLQERFEKLAAMPVWEEIADRVSEALKSHDSGEKKGSTTKLGGLNSGRFSRASQVTFDNVTALLVTLPELEQAVYLKGYTGAVYTASGWEALERRAVKEYHKIAEEYGITAQEQGYMLMEMIAADEGPVLKQPGNVGEEPIISQGSIQIEYITANKSYVYAPYYINPRERGNYGYEEDGYLSPDTRTGFMDFTFLLPSKNFLEWFSDTAEKNHADSMYGKFYTWQQNDTTERYRQFTERYKAFVYEYYTELPEGHEELAELLKGAAGASTEGKIKAVQQYLSRYEYTLSPGELPRDKDFVNYFLFENKKGYCVHFASSAVLMLRSLGVPARYAEGYLITAQDIAQAEAVSAATITEKWEMLYEDGKERYSFSNSRVIPQKRVEVRDYTAHAWVEVYVEEIGWIPIEVTNGYMSGGTPESRPEEITAEAEKLPSPTPVPTRSATPTPLPTNTPVPVKDAGITKGPEITDMPGGSPTGGAAPAGSVTPGGKDRPTAGNEPLSEEGKPLHERIAELPAWVKAIFKAAAAVGCVVALIFLRYRLVWNVRRKRRRTRRGWVLWYYDRMEQMLCLQGICALPQEGYEAFAERVAQEKTCVAEAFAACQQIALAAGFGRARIREEETDFLEENYRKMRDELFANCSGIRKWYVKFIKLY